MAPVYHREYLVPVEHHQRKILYITSINEAKKSSINGCNYKILLTDFDTECVFEEGDNTIEFTPKKTGIYTYSCWMGMITGKIYVESE